MTHPALVGLIIMDLLGLFLVLAAGVAALRVLLGWAPGAPTAAQLRLERQVERAGVLGRLGANLLIAASALLIASIATLLPDVVPGAMCGTGVMASADALGDRLLWTRGAAVCALLAWRALDGLDRTSPTAPLATASARALLLALPLCVLGVWDTARFAVGFDTSTAVRCCAAVYDQVRSGGAQSPSADWVLWLFGGGGAVLLGLGLGLGLSRRLARPLWPSLLFFALVVAWCPVAWTALVRRLVSYHYEVLAHHCPWCLFVSDHGGVGWLLFAALALCLSQATAAVVSTAAARRVAEVRTGAASVTRRAGLVVAAAVVTYSVAAVWPALRWYQVHGVWLL